MGRLLDDIQYATVDGRTVRYRNCAATADANVLPILFVHGLGCSSDVWLPSMKSAAGAGCSLRLIAPDLPGYGKSPGPPRALGMEELGDWLARFLDAIHCERAHVIGHSMGCQVTLAFARNHPDRIGKLILANPTAGCRHAAPGRYFAGLAVDAFHETAMYSARLLRMAARMGARRYLMTVATMMREDSFNGVEQVTAPALVLRGGLDPIVSDKLARRLADTLPTGSYRVTPGVAHALPFTKPIQFMRLAAEFLARPDAG